MIPLDDQKLEQSGVVANCRMNRERPLTGRGGYEAELRFDIRRFLDERLQRQDVHWLDLCSGTGRALVEASDFTASRAAAFELRIVAVDLVAHDLAIAADHSRIEFHEVSLHSWQPAHTFDLITCVHGLHYIGDKLGSIARAASWLKPNGAFLAHLDLRNLRHTHQKRFGAVVRRWMTDSGLEWHAGFHRVKCAGALRLQVPWPYLWADDTAGPNFTGQPAVHSWYGESG